MSAPRRRPATEAEAATLASAVRLRIIRLTLAEPLTNAQIAARLHRDPATTLHHVRRLVRHGFLEALPVRRGSRGSREIPYRGTRLSWSLDGAHDPSLAEAMLEAYLDEVTEVGVGALEQSRLAVQLSPDDAAALRAELCAVLDAYAGRPDVPGGEAVAVYLSVYPGEGDARNQTRRPER
ncbi:ArsR/SmtB family transcription factor [Pseudonocardia kunmingensis]|uniref:Helix-turn-helix protein n=1 Tax=Pseudonocardia kunmingensis TaxID=630975 RepID=A0A543DYB0_9PSEU|nr:winged helix-turn-helix domain-containing protein [Pseudonocardia kunmingensis]TQM14296.1 helix-turn-helix protein [Pseudonocardia kunmingensis]